MADLTTNSQRARKLVDRLSVAFARDYLVDLVERELNLAEDRGTEAAAMLAASRGPLQADKLTVDALLDTIRESLAVIGPQVAEVGMEEALEHRARNLAQAIIGNFEVRLLPADDVEAPSEEATEPLRGPR